VDLHVQFRSGTSLERAHECAHEMRDAIVAELPTAEVLIHVEPESSLLGPGEKSGPFRAG
jgi:divalent metal cation (Fe/Co/Zn/Cd) transporter